MNEFITLVQDMRDAQKEFFRLRRSNGSASDVTKALDNSKRLELKVDNMLKELHSNQGKLELE